ncbi:PREDICTED: ADP-ribosylation factor-like protein 6-interacting protein 4 [Tarenaya hassleriana]|uniref:ADP-ribosylation factor-like protein 6-interacting protein 4 n=1 Tax=Tarenaya hassleriana TaxID=28532 RepID=UPI00053C1793|nr:PREDICTED: ADP-ribosylation factor-like protein 6-interacting protein 4 [Tarenaya hassleriana]
MDEKWKISKKETSASCSSSKSKFSRSFSTSASSAKSPVFVRSSSTKCSSVPSSSSSSISRSFSRKERGSSSITQKYSSLAKEQKARFYIMRSCKARSHRSSIKEKSKIQISQVKNQTQKYKKEEMENRCINIYKQQETKSTE